MKHTYDCTPCICFHSYYIYVLTVVSSLMRLDNVSTFVSRHCPHQCMSLQNNTVKTVYPSTKLRTWMVGGGAWTLGHYSECEADTKYIAWTLGRYSDYTSTSFGPWVATMMGSQTTYTKHRLYLSLIHI